MLRGVKHHNFLGVAAAPGDRLECRFLGPYDSPAALPELLGTADYQSRSRRQVFTVRAEARTAGGGIFVREAVARVSGDPEEFVVFYTWKQGVRRAPDEDDASRLARD